ncbi:hypothetical protein L6R52_37380, partial [Myxococcota bacterium]|nr:hypothetical protein [Myxococcota bacterium]
HHRGHLTSLLEVITARASFGGAVLSDEVGLTVADTGVEGADAIAAAASMLLTLADRLSTSGQPAPVGFVARDGEGHLVLHRIFTAGEQRYVLTAVAKSGALGPDTLDPVLPELRRILAADTAGDAR